MKVRFVELYFYKGTLLFKNLLITVPNRRSTVSGTFRHDVCHVPTASADPVLRTVRPKAKISRLISHTVVDMRQLLSSPLLVLGGASALTH
jgi:hypothetical protein